MTTKLYTSESVTEGHPDKICDQISDAILDAIIAKDPDCRVACETAVTTGLVLVYGQITTGCYVDIPRIVRETIRDIGYTRAKYGFDADTCSVILSIAEQSTDIAMGVDKALEVKTGDGMPGEEDVIGAGDQGMMIGYATNESENYIPLPIDLAHQLAHRLADVRKTGLLPYLRPDGKTQVTVEYEHNIPIRVDTIVIAAQHNPGITQGQIRSDLIETVVKPVVSSHLLDDKTKYLINPTGRFVIGGPLGDSGVTGRKIIVDTYGGLARHGGGAFSGKDPTKVDRTGAYAVRYVAKNVVAAGLADRCEIQVAYAIGVANPVAIVVDTLGTGKIPDDQITSLVKNTFDLRPASIIKAMDLRRPLYRQTAAYGHFGRSDLNLPWEKTNLAEKLRQLSGF